MRGRKREPRDSRNVSGRGRKRRESAYAAGVVGSFGVGASAGAAALGLWRFDGARFEPVIGPAALPSVDLGFRWSRQLRLPLADQQEALAGMLVVIAALAAVGIAVAAVNSIVLHLTRVAERRAEMGIRVALGAPHAAFLGEHAAPAVLTSAAAAVVSVMLGVALLAGLGASMPDGLVSRYRDLVSPVPILAIAFVVGLLVMLPAIAAVERAWRRSRPHEALATGGRATAGAAEAGARTNLAVLQIAGLVVLLAGAGALLRGTMPEKAPEGLGYRAEGVRTLDIELPPGTDPAIRGAAWAAVLRDVGRVTGVHAESIATPGVWLGLGPTEPLFTECGACAIGNVYTPFKGLRVQHHSVTPGHFAAMGVEVLSGREITPADSEDAPPVAIVNRAYVLGLAFEDLDPIGKVVAIGGLFGDWYTIVGVVADLHAAGLGSGSRAAPAIYLPIAQAPPSRGVLAFRGDADGSSVADAVERAGGRVAPRGVVSLRTRLDEFAAPLLWMARLIGILTLVALAVAVFGVFSVMRLNVRRREPELAVRLAIGASPGRVVRLVLREALRIAAVGATVGGLGALLVGRMLQLRVAGIRLFDPVLLGGIVVLLAATALTGAYAPARRAGRLEPMIAMRRD